jgi:LysR family glycine cleavage system transcriptional activator
MDRLPPLNALRAFEAVGRLHSVTAAANELCVTPAAVSRHLKTLEEHLEIQLFIRSHRSITLTRLGEQYLEEVTTLFTGIRRATASLVEGRKRRVLKIRSPATFAVRWLIPRLASFHATHPGIEVKLTTSFAPLDFDKEDIDAGVELGDGNWQRMRADKLVANEMTPVCSPALIKGKRAPFKPSDLAGKTLLHTLARPDDWALWLKAANASRVDPYGGMKYETSMLAYEAAAEGCGFAMAQKALVAKDLREGKLVAPIDFVLDMGAYSYYFVSPLDRRSHRALESFRKWITTMVEK